jgi:hypothetical protein
MRVGDQHHATTAFRLGKRPGTITQKAEWAPGARLDRRRKSRLHRGSIPGPSHLHLCVVITRRPMRQSLGNLKRRNALSHIGGAALRKVLLH